MNVRRRLVPGCLSIVMLLGGLGVRQAGAESVPDGLRRAFLEAAARDGVILSPGEGGHGLPAGPVALGFPVYPETKATAANGGVGDCFGVSVDVSGDTAVIGANFARVNGAMQGAAYVFHRAGGVWSQGVRLVPADGAEFDGFGISVAISGDTVLVGANSDDVNGLPDQGSAYVFVHFGDFWIQVAHLVASDGAANDGFGISVDFAGSTALVGANAADVSGRVNQGAAYVFVNAGGAWSQQAKLVSADGEPYDDFGRAVALSGETALVGARDDVVNGIVNQGSVYVFTRSGGTWSQQARLAASDGAEGDGFGCAVALSGDSALVGAYGDDVNGQVDQGSAYVFVRTGATWNQQAKLVAAEGAAGDFFGTSVALSGATALAGAPFEEVVSGPVDQGAAYLFIRSGSIWTQHVRFTATDGATEDWFGFSVALYGDTALVGSPLDDVNGQVNQGSAFLFGIYPLHFGQDLTASASAGAPSLLPGDVVTLSAGIKNWGPGTDDVLVVSAPLPSGLTYLSHVASAGGYDPAEGTWVLGSPGLKASATLDIRATVALAAAGTQPAFTVALLGTDANNADNRASLVLQVGAPVVSVQSRAGYDGWVLESTESSSRGGKINVAGTTLLVGDDKANRQYRAVLCFDTSALPDNAVITSATLMLKSAGIKGTDPFRTHRNLLMDVRTGVFSNSDTLQNLDFQAAASRTAAGTVGKTPVGGWYSGALTAGALPFINKTGLTQVRLRFKRDDNNDRGADYLRLFSGNAPAADRPVLVVEYAVP